MGQGTHQTEAVFSLPQPTADGEQSSVPCACLHRFVCLHIFFHATGKPNNVRVRSSGQSTLVAGRVDDLAVGQLRSRNTHLHALSFVMAPVYVSSAAADGSAATAVRLDTGADDAERRFSSSRYVRSMPTGNAGGLGPTWTCLTTRLTETLPDAPLRFDLAVGVRPRPHRKVDQKKYVHISALRPRPRSSCRCRGSACRR